MKKLDKTLSALDIALQESRGGPPRDGEFTVEGYLAGLKAQGVIICRRAAWERLNRMVTAGKISVRQGILWDGRPANIYGKP